MTKLLDMKTILKNIFSQYQDNSSDFIELFWEHKKSSFIKLENNKIEQAKIGLDYGIGIRKLRGEKTDYTHTNEDLLKIIPQKKDLELASKLKTIETANKIARSYTSEIVQVSVIFLETMQEVVIANTENLIANDFRHRSRFVLQITAKKNDLIQTAYEAPGCLGNIDEIFKKTSMEELVVLACKRVLKMLTARKAPAGQMPVVLMSSAGGTMIHEACGHSLEADFIFKKTSVFTDKLGQKVASKLITVVDDASLPNNFGSYKFDDEGTKAQKTVLIENGILKAFLTDRLYAKLLDLKTSGNGRRESFRNKPVPRMTNTYIAKGNTSPKTIVNSLDKGLLVKRMGGGQVDVTNGDFVFEVNEGYLVENGEIIEPVRGAILIGNGPKVLQEIDMVGNDHFFQEGVCGKYDHVPVSDAQPTLRIPAITVGGSE